MIAMAVVIMVTMVVVLFSAMVVVALVMTMVLLVFMIMLLLLRGVAGGVARDVAGSVAGVGVDAWSGGWLVLLLVLLVFGASYTALRQSQAVGPSARGVAGPLIVKSRGFLPQ